MPSRPTIVAIAATSNELAAATDSPAHGHHDLLTVLMHELGHMLGYRHATDTTDLMNELLPAGIRRFSLAEDFGFFFANDANVAEVLNGF